MISSSSRLLLVVFFLWSQPASGQSPGESKQNILRAYRSLTDRLGEGASCVIVSKLGLPLNNKEATGNPSTASFFSNGPNALLERSFRSDSGEEYNYVSGVNDDYYFQLEKTDSLPSWNIKELILESTAVQISRGRYVSNERLGLQPQELFYRDAFVGWFVEGVGLEQILASSSEFKNESSTRFQLTQPVELAQMPGTIHSGWLAFDGDPDWRLVEFDVEIEAHSFDGKPLGKYGQRGELAWQSIDGVRVPKEAVVEYGALKELGIEEPGVSIFSVSDFAFDHPSGKRFRLTHYGLPEPNLRPALFTRIRSWVIVAAAVCLLVIVARRRLLKS